jgi:hypothetical protein
MEGGAPSPPKPQPQSGVSDYGGFAAKMGADGASPSSCFPKGATASQGLQNHGQQNHFIWGMCNRRLEWQCRLKPIPHRLWLKNGLGEDADPQGSRRTAFYSRAISIILPQILQIPPELPFRRQILLSKKSYSASSWQNLKTHSPPKCGSGFRQSADGQ